MSITNVSVFTNYSDGAIIIGKNDAGEPMKFRVGEADAARLHGVVPMRNTAQSVNPNGARSTSEGEGRFNVRHFQASQ